MFYILNSKGKGRKGATNLEDIAVNLRNDGGLKSGEKA